ncbi:MAG: DUF305 domain-containing protein [Nocardiopsaceae bacterium]|nr:DUF305 domain-containing protein [Nocardiopsaceae bacterium]
MADATDEEPGHTPEDANGTADLEDAGDTAARPRQRRTVPLFTAVVLVAIALICGYLLGRPGHPIDTSADAGFLRDMSVHHAQAVDLSMIILEESEDPILRAVARDIARTQQEQIGRMQGWLMQWELPARGTQPAMAWMSGHGGHGPGDADGAGTAPMPGLVSEEEMERLRGAKGQDAEILFLRLMIDHHRGGIEMAEAEVVLGDEPMVVEFASGMAEAQQVEIDMMRDMLEERGADPDD